MNATLPAPWGVLDAADASVELWRPDRASRAFAARITRPGVEPVAVAWRNHGHGHWSYECTACGPGTGGDSRCQHVTAARRAAAIYRDSHRRNPTMPPAPPSAVPTPDQLDAARAALPARRADVIAGALDPAKFCTTTGAIGAGKNTHQPQEDHR